ncbi:DUF1294 domain-containing protein [Tissierella sp. MB52-C2]|uniref:DUF1294 domain-containing protein n=1 Tax=Tissierella sp. MB52-C2 TaxID=3070999 RepID=UPI00280BCE64|nr:DUF1294 domain-containing protein [Tissierella sp. MB52-C2]WMM25007.1 DUF1294 domain-containing protein [Tissierella sp. MB52-C2]
MANILNFNNKEIFFLGYLICINILSFIIFGIDKSKAQKKQWRIPELYLLIISFLGGSIGSLMAMVLFKHKLSKKKFYIGIPLLIIVNKIMELIIFSSIR